MIEKHQMTIDGRLIGYQRAGTGSAVVLLHGIGGNAGQWSAQLTGLSDEFTMIAWDTPGYGDSDDPAGDWRMADYAVQLVRLLDGLRLDRVHVIGQSWGGVLAQELYREYHDRVRSLILSDTFAGSACRSEEERNASLQARLNAVETMTPAEMAKARLPMLIPDGTAEAVRQEIESMLAMIHPAGYRQAAIALYHSDERDVLATIDVPTLVIAGEHDRIVPLELSRMLFDGIAGSRLEVISGTGHLSNQEKPETYNQIVREFLNSVDA